LPLKAKYFSQPSIEVLVPRGYNLTLLDIWITFFGVNITINIWFQETALRFCHSKLSGFTKKHPRTILDLWVNYIPRRTIWIVIYGKCFNMHTFPLKYKKQLWVFANKNKVVLQKQTSIWRSMMIEYLSLSTVYS